MTWGDIFGWCVVIYYNTRVIFNHMVISVHTNKIYRYGKTRLIWDHRVIHVHTNRRYEECVVFSHLIDAGVCSTFACIGYLYYSILIVILLFVIDVRGYIKLIKLKQCIVLWIYRRIEEVFNMAVNYIPEDFYATRLEVEIRKLYVWSCVQHLKYFSEMKVMERSN